MRMREREREREREIGEVGAEGTSVRTRHRGTPVFEEDRDRACVHASHTCMYYVVYACMHVCMCMYVCSVM